MDRIATNRVRITALCAAVLALTLAVAAAGSVDAAPAAKTKPSAIKKAKKKALKKTKKAVRAELQSSDEPGLAQPAQAPKIKISSCKQLRAGKRLKGFKCSWSAKGELPGLVPFRCAGKAKLKKNGRKIKRLNPCNNNLEALAPLLESPHPVSFGYYEDWAVHSDLFNRLAGGGAKIARVNLPWSELQPNQGTAPANWSWGPSDRIYASLRAVGVQPVWTLIDAPCWAAAGACTANTDPPADNRLSDYGAAAAQVAQRYPQSAGIEIWLEPNVTAFWGGAPEPNKFADLVSATSSAVRATGSQVPLITGGLAPGEADPSRIVYGDFLAQALEHGGIETADAIGFDAVTATPFTSPDDLTAGYLGRLRVQLQDLRSRMAAAGKQLPIAITELAYSTSGEGAYTEDQQAAALDSSYGVLRRIPNVSFAIVTRLLDNGDGSKISGFGVLRPNGSPKAAYCRLATTTGAPKPNGC